MLKKFTFQTSGFLLLALFCFNTNGQVWQWAKSAQGHNADRSRDIVTDKFGNSYIYGTFDDSIKFGNGITLFGEGGTYDWDYFLAKYDNLGNILWAIKIDRGKGIFNYLNNGITIDSLQNLYVIGEFSDTVKIGSSYLTASTFNDSCYNPWTDSLYPCILYSKGIFIAQYNPNGNLNWFEKICETKRGNLNGNAISVDNSGNCYVTGAFSDTMTLNNNLSIISNGLSTDIFIAKTNNIGIVQWVKKAGGVDINEDVGYDLTVDKQGNSFVTGIFRDTATFDSYVLTSTTLNMFLAKYDNTGNCVWANKIEGSGYSKSIAIDKFSNCYITGWFSSQAIFDTILLTGGGDDIFIAKYSENGNCLWAKNAGGIYHDEGYSIAIDDFGNCYVTGNFRDIASFDNISLTSNYIDIFIAKYDFSGYLNWVIKVGGFNNYVVDEGWGIAIDNSGSVYITGIFQDTILFGSNSIVSAGWMDIFVAKLYDSTVGQLEITTNENSINIFPNPFSSQTFLQTDIFLSNAIFSVNNILGQTVKQINNISGKTIVFYRDNLPSGLYLFRVTQDNKVIATEKMIITD